jgi:GntR family transcriptional regulator, transcriptional repressor for pyruvate dehydrogenase complex
LTEIIWYDNITEMNKFRPVKKMILSQLVAEEIIRYIKKGYFNVDDKLPPERELCERFNVSRTALREGIKSLVHMGILESIAGSGVYVKNGFPDQVIKKKIDSFRITDRNVYDLVELREGLESFVGEIVCSKGTDEELKNLEKLVANMEKLKQKGQSFAKEDVDFHKELAQAAHNKFLTGVIESIIPFIQQWVYAREEFISPVKVINLHKVIVKSLKEKNPEEVKKAIKKHFEYTRSIIQKAMKEKNRVNQT